MSNTDDSFVLQEKKGNNFTRNIDQYQKGLR